ncbi:GMC oxidoreductase [Pelagibacterium sp. H642]|uniref:GMC oxidoreductase n=1 Tax=Pelagibacterium sp. H642 TaxID=1881069 RepID=UPI002815E81B|nr:GMC oxidoreductase [Pelagibacterium sp. H642]WMT92824.1 GMC oxidoreductase [Pelagibacterium sp. H642]
MAGLVVGQRMARAGIHVITLESGGLAFDDHVHQLNQIEDISGRYTRIMTGRYRGLGGSSSHWGGRMLPISRHEKGNRDYLGQPPWPILPEETDRYEADIDKLFRLAPGSFEEDVLETVDPAAAFPRNDPDFVCRWAKWPKFIHCNLGALMRKEIEARHNWDVWINATVTSFTMNRECGRLASVTARGPDGRPMTVSASHFVIAAGTLESTRLLLWMNAETDDRPFQRTDCLGRNFQDHIMARIASVCRRETASTNRLFSQHFVKGTRRSVHLELSPQAQREDCVSAGFAYVAMDYELSPMAALKDVARGIQAGRPEVLKILGLAPKAGFLGRAAYWRYVRHQLFMPKEVSFHIEAVCEQMPVAENQVKLSFNRDRLGVPKIKLNWHPTDADERTFRSLASRIERYWHRNGLDRAAPLSWTTGFFNPSFQIIDGAVDYAHPSGTTRMGLDPSNSVVNVDLACHNVPNLSVVSASVFPTAGSANPTFTLMELAMRLADRLIAELSTLGLRFLV